MGKLDRTLCFIGSGLLLAIAALHSSGTNYINGIAQKSDLPAFIKTVFPVLFILPTIQLVGLAAFGVIASTMKNQANKVLIPLAILVFVNALLAFYLNALLPGFILAIPATIFALVAYRTRANTLPNKAKTAA